MRPPPSIVTLVLAPLFALALALSLVCLSVQPAQAADWKAKEQIKHYTISGSTGRALYLSIGQNGPRIGGGSPVIAHTTWDLKWRRTYKPHPNSNSTACRLVSAKPFFTIIYTLPKPAGRLKGPTARQWKTFYAGIVAHEKVHGTYARTMVRAIIDTTVGLTIQNDPKCRKIRAEVLTRVKAAYRDYKAKGRDFDRAEMAAGGNVRRLVEGLLKVDALKLLAQLRNTNWKLGQRAWIQGK